MFLIKWKKMGIHLHCRVFSRSGGGGWAFLGSLTMDAKDWENFLLSVLARHWKIEEEKEDDKG